MTPRLAQSSIHTIRDECDLVAVFCDKSIDTQKLIGRFCVV
jgi:hypothetical protein